MSKKCRLRSTHSHKARMCTGRRTLCAPNAVGTVGSYMYGSRSSLGATASCELSELSGKALAPRCAGALTRRGNHARSRGGNAVVRARHAAGAAVPSTGRALFPLRLHDVRARDHAVARGCCACTAAAGRGCRAGCSRCRGGSRVV